MKTTHYFYRLTYTDQDSIFPNFGINPVITVPYSVERDYDMERDHYVIHELSNPKADKVEKRTRDTEGIETPWEVIYEKQPES